MIQWILVGIILALCVGWLIYQQISKQNHGCNSCDDSSCPLNSNPKAKERKGCRSKHNPCPHKP